MKHFSICCAIYFFSLSLFTGIAYAADVTVLVKPGAPSDGRTQFPTIQNAVDHAPQPEGNGRVILQITPGIYHERVWIPQNRPRLTLIGLGAKPEDTVITADKFAKEQGGTFFTETVEVNGEAFEADNLTFENSAGKQGQALAISVLSDKAIFKHCRFLGYQDTLFANWGRQYYVDSYIAGAVDFIFGNAAAFFDRVEIHAVAPGYLTAQSRLSADEATGFIIRNSRVATDNLGDHKVSLGRPWRPFSRVVYLETEMDSGVTPEGFTLWRKGDDPSTMFYAEYHSTGPGSPPTARASFVRQLTAAEATRFAPDIFLQGTDHWNPEAEAARLP
ncbi:pectinesterase family protein [Silvibacterium sp.]|uniref:pectinesterase family protein n=1 Tax=Silvibacterium sp. TaxID=1964179 RepID=UPI0039E6E682